MHGYRFFHRDGRIFLKERETVTCSMTPDIVQAIWSALHYQIMVMDGNVPDATPSHVTYSDPNIIWLILTPDDGVEEWREVAGSIVTALDQLKDSRILAILVRPHGHGAAKDLKQFGVNSLLLVCHKYPQKLTRGPAHRTTSEDVQMEMIYRLTAVIPGVDDNSITIFHQAFPQCNFGGLQ